MFRNSYSCSISKCSTHRFLLLSLQYSIKLTVDVCLLSELTLVFTFFLSADSAISWILNLCSIEYKWSSIIASSINKSLEETPGSDFSEALNTTQLNVHCWHSVCHCGRIKHLSSNLYSLWTNCNSVWSLLFTADKTVLIQLELETMSLPFLVNLPWLY